MPARPAGGRARPVARGLQFLLGLLLLATGIGKALDLAGFVRVIRTYDALPEVALWPVALGMTAFELLLAMLLFARCRPAATAMACALLHVGFATWAAIALARGLDIPNCGCFGVFLARPLGWNTVVEDGAAVGVSLLLWRLVRP